MAARKGNKEYAMLKARTVKTMNSLKSAKGVDFTPNKIIVTPNARLAKAQLKIKP